MSKKFYIWKDPACAGTNIEWLELTGREFFALLKRPEGKSRRFIRLGAGMDPDAEIIYIEATEEQYREWRQEQNASDYLFRYSRDTLTCSMDSPPAGH